MFFSLNLKIILERFRLFFIGQLCQEVWPNVDYCVKQSPVSVRDLC